MKIWAKFIKEEKIVKSIVYSPTDNFDYGNLRDYLEAICCEADQPTPIILSKHMSHFINFNTTFFTPEDFVENVSFDKMVIEFFTEKKKQTDYISQK